MQCLKNGNVSALNCIQFLQLSLLADWIIFLSHPFNSEVISPNLQRLGYVLSIAHFQLFANNLSPTSFAARCRRNKQAASLPFFPPLRFFWDEMQNKKTIQESIFYGMRPRQACITALVPVESKQPCRWALETLAHVSSPQSCKWKNWLSRNKFFPQESVGLSLPDHLLLVVFFNVL